MNLKLRTLLLATVAALLTSGAALAGGLSISTQPLFVTTAVPPNIVVVLDDSGSMASAFVPDNLDDSTKLTVQVTGPIPYVTTTTSATVNVSAPVVTSGTVTSTCRVSHHTCTGTYDYSCSSGFTLNGSSTGTTSTPPSGTTCTKTTYTYSCPSGYTLNGSSTGTTSTPPSGTTCTQTTSAYTCPSGWTTNGSGSSATCTSYQAVYVQGENSVMFKSAAYNPLAYDPTVTYDTPFKADGTLYSTSFTTAYINGFDTGRGSVNLSTSYKATVSYNPSSTSQTTNDCNGTFTVSSTNITSSTTGTCATTMGGTAAYYYKYDTAASGCPATPSTADSRCYTKVPVAAGEQQNFANWYSFYRTRNLTTVSAANRAFSQLSNTMRVAWIDLGSCTAFASTGCASWSGSQYDNRIATFSGTHRTDFFNWLSRLPANVSTPLRTALSTAGEYYKTSGVNSPYAEQPQVSDGTEYVCRPNYTIMMTDGLWNSDSISSFGNTDKTAVTLPDNTSYTTSIHPYYDSSSNSLADIAFYYWKTNLRTDLGTTAALQYMPYTKNVSVVDSVNGTASLIPYWNPQNDPASWPHMNTFTVGLGMTTTITSPKWNGDTFTGTGYGDLVTGHLAWPAVSSDSANNIYDLWHAAINGRGQFFSADNPQDVAAAFNSIVSRITGRVGSSSAIAVNSTRLDSNTFIYQAQFNSGDWSGEVLAYKINTDGSIGAVQWQATSKLPAFGSRNIMTWDNTNKAGIDFTWATLTSNEQAALNTNLSGVNDGKGSERLDYLRGDQSKEQSQSGGIYRNRTYLLADIVNSNPLFIGTQNYGFINLPGSEGTSYSSFVSSKASRAETLVVGGNDGMLHGFDANTGIELFAYVPRGIYGNLSALTNPGYTHQFYVDGSPQSVDAYVSGGWKTLLTGTTGAGGREIFLINATNPSALTKSDIMWDYDGAMAGDNDMGYTIGQPTIARMHDGKWYIIFGNGYNSPNQHALIYMYRISDGTLLKFDSKVGNLNGMSTPNPVDYNGDRITDAIYAGDLLGNVWKLDVSDADPTKWAYTTYGNSNPTPLFTALDSNNNVQPITERPQVGKNTAGQVMVFFGTGTYFLTGDNAVPASPPVQAFYGIIDDKGNTAADQVLQKTLLQQTIITETSRNGTPLRITSTNPMTSDNQGWYINLDYPKAQGERVVSDAVLDNGRVIFTTVIPQGTACQYGGISWLMELDIDNGGRLDVSPFDTNGDGKVDGNDFVTVTYTDPNTGQSVTTTIPASGKQSNVGIIKTPGIISAGTLEYKYYSGSTGAIGMTVESASSSGGRQSWQQLQ
ncbi:MAG TPA: PilC/PilY family type IV pilus protein [Gammaproteobacteria bacterium]|jgi:type IV pilus assembly protein PilY1|nr:PilC/PilY family type IV pilus protein [Gammaproteobacteria bacterium]